jgi:hypothetical protein
MSCLNSQHIDQALACFHTRMKVMASTEKGCNTATVHL